MRVIDIRFTQRIKGKKMKHEFIEANTLEDAWFLTLYRMIDEGRVHTIDRGSFAGQKRIEFDYVTIQIKNPCKVNLIPNISDKYNIKKNETILDSV